MSAASTSLPDHHRALVRGFIENTLTGEEHTALEVHLRDADIARHFLRELHFDQAIRITARSQIRRAEIEAAPTAQVATARLRIRRPSRVRPRLQPGSWARAAIVLMIVGLSAWMLVTLPVTSQPTAELMVHLGTVEVTNSASLVINTQGPPKR